ncbi:MAG: hypothetical protein H9Q67_06490, partial [Spiroplasma ixodetis]|nr:hypothetical protein [Spiroplasma ixodetis]
MENKGECKASDDFLNEESDSENDVNVVVVVSENRGRKQVKKDGEFSVIASSAENFISFDHTVTEKIKARFIDSCRFLLSLIDSLAKNFEKEKDTAFSYTQSVYSGEQFELATRKGVFPYEYITDQSVYKEEKL